MLAITYGNLYFKWPKIVFSYCQTHKREIAQIVDINGNTFLTNSIPITVKDKIKGAVAIFTDIESIQKNEINVRKHLNKKGFVAKYKFSDILGNSDAILQTKELAESYAKTDFTVLITGESGVGKELFAQSIHNSSLRKTGPFVAINCSALNSNLLESELFGYERGSFTGARSEGKPGLFELAHNGTIFLAVEAGAKVGLIPYDSVTREYLEQFDISEDYSYINPDKDANYEKEFHFKADDLEPQIACPHEVDNVTDVTNVEGTKIDQAYIGSCTGGRYNDLKEAARILKGKKVAKGVRLLISPASKDVYDRCLNDGILKILSEAGAVILAPSCGACLGIHSGTLAAEEVCISATNRNFLGRMGSKDSQVYLGSPLSVAAAAVTGYITDCRQFV